MPPPVDMGPIRAPCSICFRLSSPRWKLQAGALSGGEQQMLAMARALIQRPKVLLIDELSMGLAPMLVERLFAAIRQIATDHECAVMFVEQYVGLALKVADTATVLNRGQVVLNGSAAEMLANHDLLESAYLGSASDTDAVRCRSTSRVAAQAGHHVAMTN